MTVELTLRAIGHVRGGRVEAVDDDWGDVEARIELDAERVLPDVVTGLADFSTVRARSRASRRRAR